MDVSGSVQSLSSLTGFSGTLAPGESVTLSNVSGLSSTATTGAVVVYSGSELNSSTVVDALQWGGERSAPLCVCECMVVGVGDR